MKVLALMIVCGVFTFLTRFSFIAASRFLPKTPRFYELLRFVPPAIFAALIAPDIFLNGGDTLTLSDNPRLIAAVVAVFIAFFTKNVLLTIASGMAVVWVTQLCFPLS